MPFDRLYNRLPAHIRNRDIRESEPLRALMAVLENEYDILEDDVRQLYDNWFIETCENWAVPYIGDLLGVRHLADDPRGTLSQRAYVANTLEYRRSKGTAAVLEQLARDVTLWPARAVELFQLLTQSQHTNHFRPEPFHTVDLKNADRALQVDTPFDMWGHTIDIRAITDGSVHQNIPNIAIFLWRLQSYRLGFAAAIPGDYQGGVQPCATPEDDGRFRIDPVGRDLPLFNRPRADAGVAQRAVEGDLPVPLRRYPLFTELETRRAGDVGTNGYFGKQPVIHIRMNGTPVPPARLHACDLTEIDTGGGTDWPRPSAVGHVRFDPVTGRISLHPDDAGATLEVAHSYGAADDFGGGPYDRRESVESWIDKVRFGIDNAPADLWQIGVTRQTEALTDDAALGGPVVNSLVEALERWNTTRNQPGARGLITILENASYDEDIIAAIGQIELAENATLAIVAAGWPRRPGGRDRLIGELVPQECRPHISSNLRAVADDGEGGVLILDGLLIEGDLVIGTGDLHGLELYNVTLGATANGLDGLLHIEAENPALSTIATRSILPRIQIDAATGPLSVIDSTIGEDRAADGGRSILTPGTILDAAQTDLTLERCTVFGGIGGRTLSASDCLFTGVLDIARRQVGCVRYSYVPEGAHTPRRFRCQPDLELEAALARKQDAAPDGTIASLTEEERDDILSQVVPRFTSSVVGDPTFAQLHDRIAPQIAAGGERGTEMGVLAGLGQPIRRANLERAVQEYLRLGLEAGLFYAT